MRRSNRSKERTDIDPRQMNGWIVSRFVGRVSKAMRENERRWTGNGGTRVPVVEASARNACGEKINPPGPYHQSNLARTGGPKSSTVP